MYYRKLNIQNFKGISNVTVDLTDNRVVTLVGLNESGKTTIMEAIELFYLSITEEEPEKEGLNPYRPKGIKFTGSIILEGELFFEEDDIERIQDYWKNEMGKRRELEIERDFSYKFEFVFRLHEYVKTNRTCSISIKTKGAQKNLAKSNKTEWQKVITFIKENLIPEILYYEDFIFAIPEEIDFPIGQIGTAGDGTPIPAETAPRKKQTMWHLVVDDVLKAVDPRLDSFQKYVADIWYSDKDTAKNRVSQMKKVLNEKITQAWKELFGKKGDKLNFKEISLQVEPKGDQLSVAFGIETDTGDVFSINERSKGCKWFFSFLLFTEFRKNRTKNILFLLDEPASNLHSSAQKKILEALDELSKQSMVVYSTHSNFLIRVEWLSGAYVIINEVMTEEMLSGNVTLEEKAKITAQKYFDYVGQGVGSDKVSYFQPILDALDYQPSYLTPAPGIVLLEGRNDWYTFKYFQDFILKDKTDYNLYPGGGRGKLYDPINLYLSWGQDFWVLLDGDKPGKSSKQDYLEAFPGYLDGRIHTLEDVVGQEIATEGLIEEKDKKLIFDAAYGTGKFDARKIATKQFKEDLNRAIMQLAQQKKELQFSKKTVDNFQAVFKFIADIKSK